MVSVKSLMGTITREVINAAEVSSAGVSVHKGDHSTLSLGDKLKLSKFSRKGRKDKFSFFQVDVSSGSEFCTL